MIGASSLVLLDYYLDCFNTQGTLLYRYLVKYLVMCSSVWMCRGKMHCQLMG